MQEIESATDRKEISGLMAGFITNKTHKAAFAATRRRFLVMGTAGAALCLFPILAGCSGGSKKDAPDSDYIGSYRAAYTIPGVGENGTFSFSVAQKGNMIGSFVDTSSNVTRAFSGHVDNNGTFSGKTTDADGTTTFDTNGTVSKVISSSTGGDFTQYRAGKAYSGSFSYVTTGVEAPSSNGLAGTYNGSFNLSGQTAGPASFSIDTQGKITGFVTTNGETGTLTGQASNTGAFSATVTYASGSANLAGTLIKSTTSPDEAGGNFVQTKGGVSTPGRFGGAIQPPADSPYANAYFGSYNLSDQIAGPASFTIDKQGNITGLVTTNGEAGTLRGQVSNSGAFTGTIIYPSGQATIGGSLVATTDNTAAGNFTQTKDNVTTPGRFAGPIALPADSPFIGSYQGNYGVPDKQESGAMSFTVDVSGELTGSLNLNNTSPAGVFKGTMISNGNFIGTVEYPASNGSLPTRTVKGRMATQSGGTANSADNTKLQGDFVIDNGSSTVGVPGYFDTTRTSPKEIDSVFRGAYSNGANVPAFRLAANPAGIPTSGAMVITVDKEGAFLGTLGGLKITGAFTNDGRVSGSIVTNSGSYPLSGKISKQGVPIVDANTGQVGSSAGIAGNIIVTIDGVEYNGSIQVAGGFTGG